MPTKALLRSAEVMHLIERIGKSIHAHPTLSEMVESAARAAR